MSSGEEQAAPPSRLAFALRHAHSHLSPSDPESWPTCGPAALLDAADLIEQQAARIADLEARLAAAEAKVAAYEAEPMMGWEIMSSGKLHELRVADPMHVTTPVQALRRLAAALYPGNVVVALHARELPEEVTRG